MTTFVIAGSYHEYIYFLENHNLPKRSTEYTFISDPTRLYGMRDTTILCVGKYWLSPVYEWQHIDAEKRARNIAFVNELGIQIA